MGKIRVFVLAVGIIVAIQTISWCFEIKLKRDPFMDLVKSKELLIREQEAALKGKKKTEAVIKQQANAIASAIKVQMIVVGKDNKSKAALLVGPSGIPVVVVKGTKIKDDIWVEDITNDAVKVGVSIMGKKEIVTLKLAK
ncbi:hypothetical protein [Hippea jasoniae]|uniref:hypothetical protein n=1 Tax=Hippea jasoniae TaxID=944479 RepID=UPI00054DD23C|nr:hypothetical protein [Hippea jasoniae]